LFVLIISKLEISYSHCYHGGRQEFNTSIDSSGKWISQHAWGNTENTTLIGYGLGYNGVKWTNSKISLNLDSLNITGGSQMVNNITSSSQWIQRHVWGNLGISDKDQISRQMIASSLQSWSEHYGWGNSQVYLFTDLYGKHAVGGKQMASSDDSSKPLVEVYTWGSKTDQEQLIVECKCWSFHYGWGNSWIYLYLN